MANFSATDVAFAGIRFVRERPAAVAIWAGVQVLISLVFGALYAGMMGPRLAGLQSLNQAQIQADPSLAVAMMGRAAVMYAVLIPLVLVFYSVLYATMARAVLRPSDDRLGYIRFGMDEVRQGLLLLLFVAVAVGAEIAAGVLAAIPLGLVAFLAPGFLRPAVVLCLVILAAAAIYCLVRLSLAKALTFDTRRVNLFGSWALTRGQFWKMLGTYLLIAGLALVIGVLTMIIAVAVAAVLGGIGAMASIFRPSVVSLSAYFAPARLAVSLLWALVTPLFWALVYMPPMEIYRQLRGQAEG